MKPMWFCRNGLIVISLSMFGCGHIETLSDQWVYSPRSLIEFGAEFSAELDKNPAETCQKYTKAFQKGDWRAGWVLSLSASQPKKNRCLSTDDAIRRLSLFKSQYAMYPELVWLNQFHLKQLQLVKKKEKQVATLRRVLRGSQKKVARLKRQKKMLAKKLQALKAIESNINP
ncbi:MAG: hypothetical protein KAG19_01960 [Methylococcales bacterium]|nr:hypothetical protein [Methylococcales bacterium]